MKSGSINHRGKRISEKTLMLRNQMWPEVKEDDLWVRTKKKGFTTIPRLMPLIMQIMDGLVEGKPVSRVYLSLWCRVFDESMVTIPNPNEMALEAGFSGSRAESNWASRVGLLKKIGFIDIQPGPSGNYHFVLIYNPYQVIKKLHKEKKVDQRLYNSLLSRAHVIGANDLNDEHII